MSSIINLIALFTSIFRISGNAIRIQKAKKIIQKLETDADYRNGKLAEMDFPVGKKVGTEYLKFYNSIKQNAINIQTSKYEVKAVVDIDVNAFLIFLVCNDTEVEVASASRNKLSEYVRLMYFKISKNISESRTDVKTYVYNDSNEKYLMTGFYSELENI